MLCQGKAKGSGLPVYRYYPSMARSPQGMATHPGAEHSRIGLGRVGSLVLHLFFRFVWASLTRDVIVNGVYIRD